MAELKKVAQSGCIYSVSTPGSTTPHVSKWARILPWFGYMGENNAAELTLKVVTNVIVAINLSNLMFIPNISCGILVVKFLVSR